MQPAIVVVRGYSQTSSAQTGTHRRLPRRTPLQPASSCEHRFPLFYKACVPPGGSGERAAVTLTRVAGYRRSPQGKTTTPNYSLKHAHSGSDNLTASTSSTVYSTSPLRASAILTQHDFHELSRAPGPQ